MCVLENFSIIQSLHFPFAYPFIDLSFTHSVQLLTLAVYIPYPLILYALTVYLLIP